MTSKETLRNSSDISLTVSPLDTVLNFWINISALFMYKGSKDLRYLGGRLKSWQSVRIAYFIKTDRILVHRRRNRGALGARAPQRFCNKQRSSLFIFQNIPFFLRKKCPRSVVPPSLRCFLRPCLGLPKFIYTEESSLISLNFSST